MSQKQSTIDIDSHMKYQRQTIHKELKMHQKQVDRAINTGDVIEYLE